MRGLHGKSYARARTVPAMATLLLLIRVHIPMHHQSSRHAEAVNQYAARYALAVFLLALGALFGLAGASSSGPTSASEGPVATSPASAAFRAWDLIYVGGFSHGRLSCTFFFLIAVVSWAACGCVLGMPYLAR